ncbi:MAG: hypothetical protein WEA58_07745 [Balneolaceae bacterium]
MNSLNQQDCHYITANRTIENVIVSNGEDNKEFFIYNDKGISYRVFKSQKQLNEFWKGEENEQWHFETEKELDHFLISFELS